MKKGINYNVGLRYHDPGTFDAQYAKVSDAIDDAKMRDELGQILAMGCDSVRIYGDDREKLAQAARTALELDERMQVWISPRKINATMDSMTTLVEDVARDAEKLRQQYGDRVRLIVGNELLLDSAVALPGTQYEQRAALYARGVARETLARWCPPALLLPGMRRKLEKFHDALQAAADVAASLAAKARPIFGGKITYAALPQEPMDWKNPDFDIIGVNAYRDLASARGYERDLAEKKALGMSLKKEVAVTEYGTASFRGAALLGGGAAVRAQAWGLPRLLRWLPPLRDRLGQLNHVRRMLPIFRKTEVDAAFLFEYADRSRVPGTKEWGRKEDVSLALTEDTRRGLAEVLAPKKD